MKDGAGDRVAGLSTRLLVLFLAMVVVGFVIPSPGIAGIPGTGTGDSRYVALPAPSDPELLIVPEIALRAPIVPIEIRSDGVLDPPSDVHEVGWWKRSAKPGSPSGQTLVTGHTVHTGGGALEHLDRFRPGQRIRVGGHVYTVRSNRTLDKDLVAQRAGRLFRQSGPARLVMVTCTDWDGTEFDANQVLVATPV